MSIVTRHTGNEGAVQEPENGLGRYALTRSRITHDAQRMTTLHLEAHTAVRLEGAVGGLDCDVQVVDVQDRPCTGRLHQSPPLESQMLVMSKLPLMGRNTALFTRGEV